MVSKRAFESARYCFTGRDEQVSTHEFHCGPGGGLTASRQPVATDVLAHPKYRAQGAICATGHEDLMKPVRSDPRIPLWARRRVNGKSPIGCHRRPGSPEVPRVRRNLRDMP